MALGRFAVFDLGGRETGTRLIGSILQREKGKLPKKLDTLFDVAAVDAKVGQRRLRQLQSLGWAGLS